MINVTLVGNVTKDPQLKEANGYKFASFSVANNVKKDKTDFYAVTVWGKQADTIMQYVKKGSKLCINGTLEIMEYGKDENKTKYPSIQATSFEFINSTKKDGTSEDRAFEKKYDAEYIF